ncbi:VOC family protein [Staphylococcus simulans]|uniref:VOC family protein n=1 Tax=Staphylococcus simulans TaxID=1286 RepID=UPI000D02B315|nr:VOC family protein [Staphylococcus simulans]PTI88297.1 ring-cleaving dioxygenase [Staphylococcus simulans]PTJ04122.1 ring-cleaving dioxygenase [Staphylococcus simulans]PTJ44385.1 ring-cleaving dioxygenase [Staphylococcus simulans]PTJ85015.1 ring-cleaving dioxygenase [Staphylococcus simulans]PTJ90834.1 ring-cleaving dioxygenase [Staphylococcus simulans]
MENIKRIHHISAIVGDAQENLDFYRNVLGLQLIKQTVNFDDPGVYHLYFSRQDDDKRMVMTFFNWPNQHKGRVGSGQVGRIAFRIPKGSMDAWEAHLNEQGIETKISGLFDEATLEFNDVHGLALALVEGQEEAEDNAIIGFHGTELLSADPAGTRSTLVDDMGLSVVSENPSKIHLETEGEEKHQIIMSAQPLPKGLFGVGTVHHVAWSIPTEAEHLEWQKHMEDHGYFVTEVKDRNYFKAIYFKEKGDIVFEMATDGPGFAVDEPKDQLGQHLQLPPQYEDRREALTQNLKPLKL